jgi:hypothetical protein
MEAWKQPDVLQWSEAMRKQLSEEFPSLPSETALREHTFEKVCVEILARFKGDAGIAAVLSKIRSRIGVPDRHLCDVRPAGLLAVVWSDLVDPRANPELYEHFRLTLLDVGGTCLQGDTHRLFATYVALVRDLRNCEVYQ